MASNKSKRVAFTCASHYKSVALYKHKPKRDLLKSLYEIRRLRTNECLSYLRYSQFLKGVGNRGKRGKER